jgi:SAM-dependent methyltransferase
MEVDECIKRWKKSAPADMRVLDIGCGTGVACQLFAEKGAKVCGLDKSEAMIKYAKDQVVASKLSVDKAKNIEFRLGDMMLENTCKGEEFTHATLFYFSVYYAENKAELFKNIHTWVRPGGYMMIEVVNKYKFDPMFQAAAPFLGFSVQKYNKDRVNKSKITFNDFKYEGDFLLLEDGPKSDAAEFREVIEFNKTGVIRRQKHRLWMPEIKELIKVADSTGWIYKGYKDMLPFAFEYSYMLFFERE